MVHRSEQSAARCLRRRVIERAGNRCEYCRLSQEHELFGTFHIEHIIARQHGGDDSEGNLCLACSSCNLHKGPIVAESIPTRVTWLLRIVQREAGDMVSWQSREL